MRGPAARVYRLRVPENPTPRPTADGRGGWCCLLLCVAPPLLWFTAGRFLPERLLWYPIWLAAVVWNGPDGHGGISHLLG